MNKSQRITELLEKYVKNLCSDEELDELFGYMTSEEYESILQDHIMQTLYVPNVSGANLEAYKSENIVRKILSSQKENSNIIRRITRRKIIRRIAVAAVATGLLLSIFFIARRNESSQPFREISLLKKGNQRTENKSDKAIQLQMEDGSHITLQPGATLVYPPHFTADKREVVLEGEAFFDIAKNPERPFMVYHENLVTRVLGTRFHIRYNKDHKEVEVEVNSGKVEVYENVKNKDSRSKSNGVIITPNQKVVYSEDKRLFSTSLVDNPLPVTDRDYETPPAAEAFELEGTAMSEIIPLLKKTYGIDIELENESLNNCLFSGDISDQNLYSKLDVLCQAIGASYELKGTRVFIKGKGCK